MIDCCRLAFALRLEAAARCTQRLLISQLDYVLAIAVGRVNSPDEALTVRSICHVVMSHFPTSLACSCHEPETQFWPYDTRLPSKTDEISGMIHSQ